MTDNKRDRIVVALGGNALGRTPEEQLSLIRITASTIVDLLHTGQDVVVTHGNGPQVGMIKVATDTSHAVKGTPPIPFPECGAMSQGYIGYHLQEAIGNEMRRRGIERDCLSLITQTLVDEGDPAFAHPTKPVGAFFGEEEARREMAATGKVFVEDSGRGWRWVVASGGGGIPVVSRDGELVGVPAVIDKDRSAALLALETGARTLLILTAADAAYRDYGRPTQRPIDHMNAEECRRAIADGCFAEGSMLPKVEACLEFAARSAGGTAIISSLERACEALEGRVGTRITAQ